MTISVASYIDDAGILYAETPMAANRQALPAHHASSGADIGQSVRPNLGTGTAYGSAARRPSMGFDRADLVCRRLSNPALRAGVRCVRAILAVPDAGFTSIACCFSLLTNSRSKHATISAGNIRTRRLIERLLRFLCGQGEYRPARAGTHSDHDSG